MIFPANTAHTISARCGRAGLKEALMGGLLSLDDTQVRDRPGQGSSRVDCSASQDGYRSTLQLNLPFSHKTCNLPAWIPMGNRRGEWATEVHFKPLQWFGDRAIVAPSDSNAFVPAAIAYPLFLLSRVALIRSSTSIPSTVNSTHALQGWVGRGTRGYFSRAVRSAEPGDPRPTPWAS